MKVISMPVMRNFVLSLFFVMFRLPACNYDSDSSFKCLFEFQSSDESHGNLAISHEFYEDLYANAFIEEDELAADTLIGDYDYTCSYEQGSTVRQEIINEEFFKITQQQLSAEYIKQLRKEYEQLQVSWKHHESHRADARIGEYNHTCSYEQGSKVVQKIINEEFFKVTQQLLTAEYIEQLRKEYGQLEASWKQHESNTTVEKKGVYKKRERHKV